MEGLLTAPRPASDRNESAPCSKLGALRSASARMAAGDVDRAVGDEKHSTLVPANNVLGPPQEATERG